MIEDPFIIQQYKWNKWVNIGEVNGTGGRQMNTYSFQADLHFGLNRIRVKHANGNARGRSGNWPGTRSITSTKPKVIPI